METSAEEDPDFLRKIFKEIITNPHSECHPKKDRKNMSFFSISDLDYSDLSASLFGQPWICAMDFPIFSHVIFPWDFPGFFRCPLLRSKRLSHAMTKFWRSCLFAVFLVVAWRSW